MFLRCFCQSAAWIWIYFCFVVPWNWRKQRNCNCRVQVWCLDNDQKGALIAMTCEGQQCYHCRPRRHCFISIYNIEAGCSLANLMASRQKRGTVGIRRFEKVYSFSRISHILPPISKKKEESPPKFWLHASVSCLVQARKLWNSVAHF